MMLQSLIRCSVQQMRNRPFYGAASALLWAILLLTGCSSVDSRVKNEASVTLFQLSQLRKTLQILDQQVYFGDKSCQNVNRKIGRTFQAMVSDTNSRWQGDTTFAAYGKCCNQMAAIGSQLKRLSTDCSALQDNYSRFYEKILSDNYGNVEARKRLGQYQAQVERLTRVSTNAQQTMNRAILTHNGMIDRMATYSNDWVSLSADKITLTSD
jgi:hypothetical protein